MYIAFSISIVGLFIFGLCMHFLAPKLILQPFINTAPLPNDSYTVQFQKLNIESHDGILLDGYLATPKANKLNAIIICLHGVGGNKSAFYGLSNVLTRINVGTYVFDSRAHGASQGNYCTYGALEKDDITIIVDSLQQQFPNTTIGIWGHSLGGAVALQSLEQDKRIEFGIIESTFSNLDEIVVEYQKRFSLGIQSKPLAQYALKRAGVIADFDPNNVSPELSAANIEQPVFMAHSLNDEKIAIEHGRRIFKQLQSTDKQFVEMEGLGHNYLMIQYPQGYFKQALEFVNNKVN